MRYAIAVTILLLGAGCNHGGWAWGRDALAPLAPDAPRSVTVEQTSLDVGHGLAIVVDDSAFMAGRRFDAAKAEIVSVVRQLDQGMQLNLFACECGGASWMPTTAQATSMARANAESWVDALRPAGPAGTGPAVKAALEDPDVETVLLVAGGTPTCMGMNGATGSADDHLLLIEQANARRGARIHCIALAPDITTDAFLRRVAADSGGRYIYVP